MSSTLLAQPLQVLHDWRELGWLRAIDFAFAEWLQQTGESDSHVILLAAFVSHQAGRGYTEVSLASLWQDPNGTLNLPPEGRPEEDVKTPADYLVGDTQEALEQRLLNSHCVDVEGNDAAKPPLVYSAGKLYLRRYWAYERFIELQLAQRMADRPVINEELLQQTLAQLFAPSEDINWQRVACANTVRNRFSVVTGGPGTGKTYTVVRLLAALQQQNLQLGLPALRVALAAPTGKAAARLTESIETELGSLQAKPDLGGLQKALAAIVAEGKTLHRLLGVKSGQRSFRHNEENPLHADVIVIDEASMMDIEMMVAVLKATPRHARIVLIGDKDQLASVEAGAVLGNLCAGIDNHCYHSETATWLSTVADTPPFPQGLIGADAPERLQHVVKFRKSYRFVGPIAELASAINERQSSKVKQQLERAKTDDQNDVQVLEINDLNDQSFARLVGHNRLALSADDFCDNDRYAAAVLAANSDFQILTAVRQGPWGMHAVNERVAELLGVNANHWYHGRPVMVTKNDYGLGLSNGDVGVTLHDPVHNYLRVAFPYKDGGVRWVLPSHLTHIETVYAMTVHKSQGSEFKHTVLVLPDNDSPVVTKELLYTGITRAKDRLTMVGKGVTQWATL